MSKLSVTETDRFIGKRIQQKRKELGFSAAELSEQIGIAQQQLSRYERGENKIIDCISDQKTNNKRKFIPVSEDSIRDRLYTHLDRLSADKKRGLLVFLETIL